MHQHSWRHSRRQRGFTIIELSIAMLIGLFLLGGLLTIVQSNRRAFTSQSQLAELQDNERLAMTMITDVIQTAGYYPKPTINTATGLLTAIAPMTAGQALYGQANADPTLGDTLTVRFATEGQDSVLNCNGTTNPGAVGTFTTYTNVFSVIATDTTTTPQKNSLFCNLNGSVTPVELVPGLERMDVSYAVRRLPTSANNADTYLTTAEMLATDWPNVIAIKVTLRFQDPLYLAGQANPPQFIDFSRVINVMNQSGVNL